MPFGKYKGRELGDVPESYLLWLLDEAENLSGTLRREITRVLGLEDPDDDDEDDDPTPPPPATPPGAPTIEAIVKAWYRRMAYKYHPDRGGSTDAMQTINDAHDHLKELAGIK
jgi:hypothetical protein